MNIPAKLKEVIQIVLHCVPVEKIALIGYMDKDYKPRSLFNKDSIPKFLIREANILVITKGDCKKKVMNDLIEELSSGILTVTCNTISVGEFMYMAQQGSTFISALQSSECFIYEDTVNPATIPVLPASPVFIKNNLEEITARYRHAVAFWEIACAQHKIGDNRMTAFCLCQATEQFLVMLIQAATGYRLGCHDISKQLQFLRFYIEEAANLFPHSKKIAIQSLRILGDCYVTSRYEIDFTISDKNIHYLISEVDKLKGLAGKVWWNKLLGMAVPVFFMCEFIPLSFDWL